MFTGVYGSAPPYAPDVADLPPPPAPEARPTPVDPYAVTWSDAPVPAYAPPALAAPPAFAPPGPSAPLPFAPPPSPVPARSAPWAAPAGRAPAGGAMPGSRLPTGPPVVPPGPPVWGASWPPPFPGDGPTAVVIPPRRRSPAGWVAALLVVVALMAASLAVVVRSAPTTVTGAPPIRNVPAAPAAPTDPNSPAGSTTDDPSSWADVAAAVNPGVVNIESRMAQGIGAGTGIVLTEDGRVLTNNHVVDGASEIQVTIAATGEYYPATIVGTDPEEDVAILQMEEASGLTTIPLGDSDAVQIGDPVAAIGNAGGRGGTPQIVTGKVVDLHTTVTASEQDGSNVETLTDMIQVDAKVVQGNSGGPLADANGKVIGINTAASASGTGRGRTRTIVPEGYAIPINRALAIGEQLAAGGSAPPTTPRSTPPASNRGYLGVEIAQGTTVDGAAISRVKAGSGAHGAGMRAGDVIVEVDGTPVASPSELTAALSGKTAGTEVEVVWQTASGEQQQATVTLQPA